MKKILDAYALLAFLEKEAGAKKVESFLSRQHRRMIIY